MYISKALITDLIIAAITAMVTTLAMIWLGYAEHTPFIAIISGLASFSTLSLMARIKLETPETEASLSSSHRS